MSWTEFFWRVLASTIGFLLGYAIWCGVAWLLGYRALFPYQFQPRGRPPQED
jgi:hypothetical protein